MKKLLLLSLLGMPMFMAIAMEQAEQDEKELVAEQSGSISIEAAVQKYLQFVQAFMKKEYGYPGWWEDKNFKEKEVLEKSLPALKSQVKEALENKLADTGTLSHEDATRIFTATVHQALVTHKHFEGAINNTPYDYETFHVLNEDGTYYSRTKGLFAKPLIKQSYQVDWVADASGTIIEERPVE